MNKQHNLVRIALVGLTALILGRPGSSFAALTNVNITVAFTFDPQVVTINVNDRVKWTWLSSFHNSKSTNTPPLWDSGIQNSGFLFTNTFPSAGGFGYSCTVHGFVGTVIVQSAAPNNPPTTTITNPPDGITLSAPATFTLQARASDSDGTVTNVQFLQGTTVLGNVTTAPYSAAVNSIGAGDYTFSSVASDNAGAKATNSIAVHVVTPVTVTLDGVQRLSDTSFQFNYTANAGLKYVVQRSTNLVDWISLGTFPATGSSVNFTDSAASGDLDFYRVGRLPNP